MAGVSKHSVESPHEKSTNHLVAQDRVKNVLLLTWEYPPRIVGGIATHVYHLSKCLAKDGISVHVITCAFPNAPMEEIVEGVYVHRVDENRLLQPNFILWIYHLNSQMIERANQLSQTEQFDLIHAHDWVVGRAAVELKNKMHIPLVSTIHATEIGRGGNLEDDYRKKILEIERLLAKQSQMIICCSNYMLDHIQNRLGAHSDNLRVIPNGVELSRFNNQNNSVGEHEQKTVLYVGRIVREKGVFTLLEALAELRSRGKNVRLVFTGEGPLKKDLAREVLRRRLNDHVVFTGFVDEEKLVGLYASSDCFVLPSLSEPFGMVALEAMASRIPVVASDVGGLAEIVENRVTGIKVPPGDPHALADSIQQVIDDQQLAERMKQNAFRMVQEGYRWDMVAQMTIEAYQLAFSKPATQLTSGNEEFLSGSALLQLLLAAGASSAEKGLAAGEIASQLNSSDIPVKLILGREASQGYVSTEIDDGSSNVLYHLTPIGIIKACSEMS
ncbi:MAG TPA: glycosyltransferase family 4 protein [Candidatus Dormibacteraeota bacterium]|nr:glycosyltransferase family 4 protein [Candidatus Dormibacteraeota bacterium]